MVTLTSPSLSSTPKRPRGSLHMPIEIIEEIICRLPVKFLSQLRCVCKSWNSIINDPKFARKHLRQSNRRILLVRFEEEKFMSYPMPSVLKAVTTDGTKLDNPLKYGNRPHWIIGSCDDIICCCNFNIEVGHSFVVWNPSIRKVWELTPLEKPLLEDCDRLSFHSYGFGYDHLSDNFKLVVIFFYRCHGGYKTHVMVHTLGSNSWRRIEDFLGVPYRPYTDQGILVSGAVNWFACDGDFNIKSIISLNLSEESYQELLLPVPVYGADFDNLTMDIMRDCLCILTHLDVWIMKEYGNNQSWTKLFSFSYNAWNIRFPCHALCVCEDDESLFHTGQNLGIYNYKNQTFRFSDLEDKSGLIKDIPPQMKFMYVEIESLISPCPQNYKVIR